MLTVEFWDNQVIENDQHIYAVIVTKHQGKWIFVRHKSRSTWEFPGGRREVGEDIKDTAKRELFEETGATDYELTPICTYSVTRDKEKSYGLLCYAEAKTFTENLTHEIAEIKGFTTLPKDMTYPEIIPPLFDKVMDYINVQQK